MSLYEKLRAMFPELTQEDFMPLGMGGIGKGYIILQDDSNGRGPYIKKWDHPTIPMPTAAQINAPLP